MEKTPGVSRLQVDVRSLPTRDNFRDVVPQADWPLGNMPAADFVEYVDELGEVVEALDIRDSDDAAELDALLDQLAAAMRPPEGTGGLHEYGRLLCFASHDLADFPAFAQALDNGIQNLVGQGKITQANAAALYRALTRDISRMASTTSACKRELG